MHSVNREANGSESLINLVMWWHHVLQLTLTRLQDAKPGWGARGPKLWYTGEWSEMGRESERPVISCEILHMWTLAFPLLVTWAINLSPRLIWQLWLRKAGNNQFVVGKGPWCKKYFWWIIMSMWAAEGDHQAHFSFLPLVYQTNTYQQPMK